MEDFFEGKEDWLEEGHLVPAKKKNGRGIPAPPSYHGGVPMLAWGSGAAIPPPNFTVPNVAFAEPYAHLPQPQQNVAIIGGYATSNMQNMAAIQTNANQMGEGNANLCMRSIFSFYLNFQHACLS
jgi:hypothetical protein